VNKFNVVDHDRRAGENCETLSSNRILLEYFDCGDSKVELKRADEIAKESRKARKEWKKSVAERQAAEAELIARVGRTKRNTESLLKLAPLECWRPLLDHAGMDITAVTAAMERLYEEPFSCNHNGIDVTLVGPSKTAVKESAKAVIFELLSRQMDNTRNNNKNKRRKGAVTMTKTGASGPSLGIRIARNSNIVEKLAKVEAEQKKVTDDLAKQKKLLKDALDLTKKLPETFWRADKTTGEKCQPVYG
jgi:hypothetical protein